MSRYLAINPSRRDHFVYEARSATGRTLYIGCTRRLRERFADHQASKAPWIAEMIQPVHLHGPFNYQKAREKERSLIIEKSPKYNVTPSDQSMRQRRRHWVKKRIAQLAGELGVDLTVLRDYVALHELASEEAAQVDWGKREGAAA